ncbi:UNVERIFIED_CONTAM: MLO protein1 [Sesamum radiatum]|uniref:MLO-like protein n=1 Tax=Sesamum radiatum TaxID=300843 RepID=A0AAW2QF79_SESRA
MAAGSGPGERSLEQTSTWAVAIVCAVFVIISVAIEHGIQSLGKWFQKREKKAMLEALEKIKAELMLLGFISLLLTVGTTYIAKICVSKELGEKWLPCEAGVKNDGGGGDDDSGGDGKGKKEHRKLLSYAQEMVWRRALAAGNDQYDYCSAKGQVSLISYSGVHQLHVFIFVLAVMHVLYSVILVVLGHAKMKKWKAWELETSSLEYQFTNDPERFRLAHQTSFVRRHSGIYTTPGLKWIVAFFRQFFGSISKVDYMTIRNGFINHPLVDLCGNVFVPQYLQMAYIGLDFINSTNLGTKLELVIMEMAQQIQDRATVVRGAPLVEPTNNFFWFNRPQWILFLIHFTLFQYEFGITTCFHEKLYAIMIRVSLGVALQILCSYITFPLYTLVTQMGSHMKKSIFEEQTAKALKKWHQAAKQRKKMRKAGVGTDTSSAGFMSGETTPTQGSSPLHLLHNYKHRSSAPDTDSLPLSPRSYASDTELSELDASNRGKREMTFDASQSKGHESHNIDFSFVKSSEG